MSDRDPRVSPVAGDVLKATRQRTVREVVQGCGYSTVRYTTGTGVKTSCLLDQWRNWARNAEVITHGDEKGTP